MLRSTNLFINIDSSNPQTALVKSTSNTSPQSIGSLVAGDTARYVITAVDSTGATSSISGDTNYKVNVAIGAAGAVSPYVTSSNFLVTGSAWSGSINTYTGSLLTAVGSTAVVSMFLTVQLVA